MMAYLWTWLLGYVTVRFRGPGLENLLNRMGQEGMLLFKVERLTAQVILARLGIGDFRRLRSLLWDSGIHVTILQRHGMPFLLHKVKLRLFLALGLIVSLFFMTYLSSFVWFIEVYGNETLEPTAIKLAVEEFGLHMGIPRSRLEPRKLEHALRTRFPELVWVQVGIKGVRVQIQLAEREGLPPPQGGSGDLYATQAGLITEVRVLRGTAKVQEGDTVLAGDLLISGTYYDARGRKQNGEAQGFVRAKIWYQGVGEAPFVKWVAQKTGRTARQYQLLIGSWTLPLGFSRDRQTHQATSREWYLYLGSAMVPLGLRQTIYEEISYAPVPMSKEEARSVAYRLALTSLERQGVDLEAVLNERIEEAALLDDDGIRLTIWAEVEEEIGRFFSQ